MIKGSVVASIFFGMRGIDLEIVELLGEVVSGPSSPRGSAFGIIESPGRGVTSGMRDDASGRCPLAHLYRLSSGKY